MSIEIYGKNPCLEVLSSTREVHEAIIHEGLERSIISLLEQKNIPINYLNKQKFLSKYPKNAQGIVLIVQDYETMTLKDYLSSAKLSTNPLILMLDGITDPHNFGAIIRSAEAGGVDAIIIPKDRSAKINATVVKVSAGAIEHMKIIEVTNLNQAVLELKQGGFWIIGTSLDTKNTYDEIFIDRPVCLIIGSEGKGMKSSLQKNSDLNVIIPMAGQINSLNASVSAGILIFDILRRKRG